MRVALVLEYAHARPWEHTGPWGIALSRALAERGHDVTVFADGVSDVERFGARVRVRLRRPLRRSISGDPLGFASWATRSVRAHGGVSLSLTRVWAGDVWMPMGRSSGDEIRRLRGLLSRPASFGMQLSQRLWVPGAVMAERSARRDAHARSSSVLSIGEPVFTGVRTLAPTSPKFDRRWMRGVDRAAVRRMLGFGDGEVVAVATAVHHADPGFAAMLGAAADAGVRVVVTGGRPHLVTKLAERVEADRAVVPIGQTERMDALIAACDVVVAPGGERGARARGTGRLVAEAVASGRPVIVGATAGGVSAARGAGWAVVVDSDDGWDRAMRLARDPAWRARASASAKRDARRFAFDEAVGVLEGALVSAEGRRADTPRRPSLALRAR